MSINPYSTSDKCIKKDGIFNDILSKVTKMRFRHFYQYQNLVKKSLKISRTANFSIEIYIQRFKYICKINTGG